jgi:hypothetical protein
VFKSWCLNDQEEKRVKEHKKKLGKELAERMRIHNEETEV